MIDGFPGLARPVPISGLPVTLSATPAVAPTRPPLLGEHTDAVLTELGYSHADISSLKEHGVI
jgi:crotonobetainyl-CoA:carnitine CoA-transferase CaiB-like acyl-CoA transferase